MILFISLSLFSTIAQGGFIPQERGIPEVQEPLGKNHVTPRETFKNSKQQNVGEPTQPQERGTPDVETPMEEDHITPREKLNNPKQQSVGEPTQPLERGTPDIETPMEEDHLTPRETFKNPKQQNVGEPTADDISPKPRRVLEAPSERSNFRCGQIETDAERIVNGTVSIKHNYPFMVNLIHKEPGYYPYHFCGGAIYDKWTVITAAHCVDGEYASYIKLVSGDWNQEKDEDTEQEIKGYSYIMHENYDPKTMFNDIAIVFLNKPLTWSGQVQPICLPSERVKSGDICKVIGWGNTEETGKQHKLRELSVPILSRKECTNYEAGWYHESWVQNKQICAGFEEGLRDSCQGDSGGPLFRTLKGVYELVGVVSWGDGCADARKPGVYQNVFDYNDWIVRNGGAAIY